MFSRVEVGLQTGRWLLVGLEEILAIEAGFGSPLRGGTQMGDAPTERQHFGGCYNPHIFPKQPTHMNLPAFARFNPHGCAFAAGARP